MKVIINMRKIILFLLITSLIFFIGCSDNKKINEQKINEIIDLIDSLPNIDQITIELEEDILNIKNSYESLNDIEKQKIVNYSKLIEFELKIKYLKDISEYKADYINKLINCLLEKDSLSLKDEKEFNFIKDEISKLSKYEFDILNKSNAYKTLNNIMGKFKEEVLEINNLIKTLPEDISLNDELLINNIKNKYNNLNDDNKSFIEDYDKFIKFENKFNELKLIEKLKQGYAINYFPDVLSSDSNDILLSSNELYSITWTSSDNNLIDLTNNKINVSKVYQTHRKQIITITATVELLTGETIVTSKEIIVNPVNYNDLSDTPVASYYQSTALSSYQSYNPRYIEDKTLFSYKAKDVLDILYFAFGHVNSKGDIIISDLNILPEIRKLKQHDVRILVSIAGINSEGSGIISDFTKDETKLALFVKNIVDTVEYCNFDGVDVDWESAGDSSVQAEGLNKLLKALREELDKRQDADGSKYLLTTAIPATSDGWDSSKFDLKTINKYVDYVNMMSYELQSSNQTTHGSALYTSSYDNGRGFSCDKAAKMFIQNGLDINKIIIGVSSYGKTFKLNDNYLNNDYPGLAVSGTKIKLPNAPGAYASGTVFLVAIEYAKKTGKFKGYIEYTKDGNVVGSYLFNDTDKIFITYDNEEVISAKYNYASNYEGMGIMNWAYTQDTYDSYIETIYNIKHNTN